MITALFILTMLSSIGLTMMGALPMWASGTLSLVSLFGLGVIGLTEQQLRHRIKRRCRQIQARWGIDIRHLGGLPVPLEASAILYSLPDRLYLETDNDHWEITAEDLRKVLMVGADQLRRLSDRQLSEELATGNVRSFASVREKIRSSDISGRRHAILMVAFQRAGEDTRLWVLSTRISLAALESFVRSAGLPESLWTSIGGNGKTLPRVV